MRWKTLTASGALVGTLALALAGCGSGDASPAPAGQPAITVTARDITGTGNTLVTAAGATLYFADQETDGHILCVGPCIRFWTPLTVSTGTVPTAGPGIGGALATVARPEGGLQVTYDGRPLYTFSQDGGAGHADGNGATDAFGGTEFHWHAAAVTGSAPTPTGTDDGYGYR